MPATVRGITAAICFLRRADDARFIRQRVFVLGNQPLLFPRPSAVSGDTLHDDMVTVASGPVVYVYRDISPVRNRQDPVRGNDTMQPVRLKRRPRLAVIFRNRLSHVAVTLQDNQALHPVWTDEAMDTWAVFCSLPIIGYRQPFAPRQTAIRALFQQASGTPMAHRIGAEHRPIVWHQDCVRMTEVLSRLLVHNNLSMFFLRDVKRRNREVNRLGPIPV